MLAAALGAGARVAVVLAAALGAGACEQREMPSAVSPPPGVAPGDEEWFWRDVLAAPFPGEAPVARELLVLEPPAARLDALAELRSSDPDAALTTLMAALRDENAGVACAAAHDLGVGGYHAAIPRLLKGLGPYPIDYDVPIEVRAAQAAALARLGNPAGIPLVLELLAEGTPLELPAAQRAWDPTPRLAFIQELALEGLVAMAGTDFGFHPSASVPDRARAVTSARAWWDGQRLSLWAAAPVEHPGLLARARVLVEHLGAYQLRQIDGARFALTHLGPGVLPLLRDGLTRRDDYVRLHCLEVMERLTDLCDEKLRGRLAVVATAPLLEEPPGIAAQAARVCGAARVAEPLVLALERRAEPEVVVAVVDALGRTGRDAARDALAAWWTPAVRAAAPPDLDAAAEAALLRLDPSRDPAAFLELLASADASLVYSAYDRLLELIDGAPDFDPASPPETRREQLGPVREMLRRARREP